MKIHIFSKYQQGALIERLVSMSENENWRNRIKISVNKYSFSIHTKSSLWYFPGSGKADCLVRSSENGSELIANFNSPYITLLSTFVFALTIGLIAQGDLVTVFGITSILTLIAYVKFKADHSLLRKAINEFVL